MLSVIRAFPTLDMEKTGQNIKRLRKQAKLSVRDLQKLLSFAAPQSVYYWERGERIPSIDTLLALATIFNTTLEDILVIRK